MTCRQHGVLRNDAQLLLPGDGFFAELVPAAVELALVLVRPFLRHMVRRVRRAGREVHEEGLVGHQRLLLTHPRDGAIREILGERVALFGRLRRLDGRGPFVEAGIVLIRFAADETVEVFEARTGRPLMERSHRAHLPERDLVTFAELRRGVAVQLQDLGDRRFALRPDAVVPRRRRRHLGDRAHPHRMVVAAREQRLTRRRAERRRVEARVLEPSLRQPFGGRRVARSAKRARRAKADVVDQHDQHVRRARRRPQRRRSAGISCSGSFASYVVRPTCAASGIGRMSLLTVGVLGIEGCPFAFCLIAVAAGWATPPADQQRTSHASTGAQLRQGPPSRERREKIRDRWRRAITTCRGQTLP